jgi:hypothetical protein
MLLMIPQVATSRLRSVTAVTNSSMTANHRPVFTHKVTRDSLRATNKALKV